MMPLRSFAQLLYLGVAISLLNVSKAFVQPNALPSRFQSVARLSISESTLPAFQEHLSYLQNVAKAEPPKKLELLLQLLSMTEDEEIVGPSAREGMNPFLIPLSRSKKDGSMLCYIRWPTQKESMDLQLVRTTDVGIYLVAMGTDQYCHRLAVEQDFFCLPTAAVAIELLNTSGQVQIGVLYSLLCGETSHLFQYLE